MRNLAGNYECDWFIGTELGQAGIKRVDHPHVLPRSEVPTRLTGKLGQFTFRRFWYYWVVNGPVPLSVAEELYAHPVGKRDVRVAGHCGCPPPSAWARHVDADGMRVRVDPDGSRERQANAFFDANPDLRESRGDRYVRSLAEAQVESFIDNYHIDSQEGLNLFAETIRRHGLDKEAP